MITCPTCQTELSDEEAQSDVCPICGGSIETSQDRDIARSMAIPKNWAANLDAMSNMFDSTDIAAVQAVMEGKKEPRKEVEEIVIGNPSSPPTEPESATVDAEELVNELSSGANEDSEVEPDPPAAPPETQQKSEPKNPPVPKPVPPPSAKPAAEPPPLNPRIYQTISNVGKSERPTTSLKIDSDGPRSLSSLVGNLGQPEGFGPSEGFGTPEPTAKPKPITASQLPIASAPDISASQSFSRESLSVQTRTFSDADAPDVGSRAAEYQILDLLGEGGMGKVYRAKQTSIDREVAVKTLRKELEDADTQQKFLAEAVVTGDLDHPNIVPIYELGADEKGDLFYSMKRVQGTPWEDVIKEKSEPENLEILMRVADAIAFAHSRGVIHRDLKPENIMLGNFGEVLVMDWGLALTTKVFNETHGVRPEAGLGGTPVYMAPEMIVGDPEDIEPTADVYLLGAILYEIITGTPPHTGKDAQECLLAVARNLIVPTDRTGEIVDIAIKAMSTNPDDRHQSVRDLQEDIREYQSHAESVALSKRAGDDLEVARKSTDYQDFARALFGFQEAVELWDGNAAASEGVAVSRVAYATSAFEKGDFDLAGSLLESGNTQEDELLVRIAAAQAERNAKEQRLRVVKRLSAGLGLAVMCIVLGAFFWIRAEAQKAKEAEAVASKERDAAEVQRKSAITAKGVAETKTAEALAAKTAADAARSDAEQKRQEALKATKAAVAERQRAEKAKQAEEYEAYIAQIGLAAAKIDENAFDSAMQLLQSCRPDLRNWEWGRLMHLCSQSDRTLGASAPVDAISVSPDGSMIVSGGWDGVARVQDVATGEVRHSLKHAGSFVYGVAYSPDGKQIATASDDEGGYVKLWNAETGKLTRAIKGHKQPALSVQFSKDGTKLLTASFDKTARLWNVSSGKQEQKLVGHTWWVWSAAYSPDESRIVTASQDGTCIIWQASDGARLAPFVGHEGPVYSASFSPDGRKVVSAGADNRVMLWDPAAVKPYNYSKLAAGEEIEPPEFKAFDGHTAAVRDVRFSADGSMLLSGSHDNTVKLWDIASRRAVKTFRGHDRWVRAVGFHPDGRRVLSGSHDKHVKVWAIADYEELRVLRGRVLAGHDDAVLGVGFSADSQSVVTCSRDRSAKVWNAGTGELQKTFAEGHSFLASSVAFFPNGQKLITAAVDNTARVWDLRTGTEAIVLEGTGRSAALALSRDGAWILTGGDGSVATLWDARSGKKQIVLEGHQVQVTAVAFSPDGTRLLTGDARGRCLLWDRKTGKMLHELASHTRRITAVAFLPDGQHALTASGDNSVGCWNVESGEEVADRILRHPNSVLSLVVLPESGRVVTVCADGFIRLWDSLNADEVARFGQAGATTNSVAIAGDGGHILTTDPQQNIVRKWRVEQDALVPIEPAVGKAFLNLKDQGGLVWSAALSPDASQVVTVGGNGARLWDARTAQEQLSLTPHAAVASATFSRDGKRLVSGSWDNSAKIWDVETGQAILKLEGVHTSAVTCANFSQDGTHVITASKDATLAIWDSKTGKCLKVLKGHSGEVNCAQFSFDDTRLLSASSDRTLRIWDVKTGKTLRVIKGHDWAITSAAFSPDGAWVVTGSEDTTARVWNVETGEERLAGPLAGHTAGVTCVAFSRDGKRVMTASEDYTAKLWDAETGKEILTLKGHTREITSVSFSDNGRYVVTGSNDGDAIVWLARTVRKTKPELAKR